VTSTGLLRAVGDEPAPASPALLPRDTERLHAAPRVLGRFQQRLRWAGENRCAHGAASICKTATAVLVFRSHKNIAGANPAHLSKAHIFQADRNRVGFIPSQNTSTPRCLVRSSLMPRGPVGLLRGRSLPPVVAGLLASLAVQVNSISGGSSRLLPQPSTPSFSRRSPARTRRSGPPSPSSTGPAV